MSELIPHLRDLRKALIRRPEFPQAFVELHSGDWRIAQSHWEKIVARVLDTDAVEARATGERAMRQAVGAAVRLLASPELHNRCPVCPRARTSSRPGKPAPIAPANTATSALTASLPGHLVGRETELSRLVELTHDVAASQGRVILIEGEPGIGKSTLVRIGCAEAACSGCQVFWGAGDELGQTLPLLPLLDALAVRETTGDPRRTTIVQLLRGDFPTDRREDLSAAATEQVLALVHELCAIAPTVLVIDDLQWADPSTVTIWERLARSIDQLPLLLVGMTRPVPERECPFRGRAAAEPLLIMWR